METVGVRLTAEDARQFQADMRSAAQSVVDFGRQAQDGGKGLSAFGQVAVGVFREVGAMAARFAVDAGKAMAGFAKDSVMAAAEFEKNTNKLGAVAGGALKEVGLTLEDVSQKALQLGKDTAFSAAEAQEAMIALAKGGVPVVDIMGQATDATLNLASAADLDLATAADIVAKQLGVWGQTGVTATQVTDRLAQAANASTVDVDELALGLANVGGAALASGVNFDDLTQTMALIAPNFSSAADAGTSLKTFLLNLEPTTKPATQMMYELGLITEETGNKFFDAQGNFVGMEQASAVLQTALTGLSDQQRATALETIFGSDAIRTADAIARAGAEGFNAMGVSMAQAGSAADAAKAQQTGFTFAMEQLSGSVDTLKIVLGTALLPVLTDLFNNYLIPGVNKLLEFADALTASENPGKLLSETLKNIGASLGDWAQEAIPKAIEGAKQLASNLGQAIKDNGPAIVESVASWVAAFVEWAIPAREQLLRAVGDIVVQLGAWIKAEGPGIAAQLGDWAIAFIQWIGPATGDMLASLGSLAVDLLGWIVANSPSIASTLLEWALAFANWVLTEAWPALIGELAELAMRFLSWIAAEGPNIASQILEWNRAMYEWVATEAIPALLRELAGLAGELLSWIGGQASSIAGKAAEIGINIIQGIKNGLVGSLGGLLSEAANIGSSVIAAAKSALRSRSPSQAFVEIGQDVNAGFVEGLQQTASDVTATIETTMLPAVDRAKNILSNFVTEAQNVGVADALKPFEDGSSYVTSLGTALGLTQEQMAALTPDTERLSKQLGIMAATGESLFTVFEDGSSYTQSLLEAFGLTEAEAQELARALTGVEEAGVGVSKGAMATLIPSVEDAVIAFKEGGLSSAEFRQAMTETRFEAAKLGPGVEDAFMQVVGAMQDAGTESAVYQEAIDALYAELYEVDAAAGAASEGIEGITDTVQSAAPEMEQAGKNLITGLSDGIKAQGDKAQDTAERVKKDVEGAIKPLKDAMKEIGKNAGQALADGVRSKRDEAKDAGGDLASAAEEGAKEKAEIASPSKVFSGIGVDMVQGLIDGMSSMSGVLQQLAGSISADLIDSFSDTIDQVRELGSELQTGFLEGKAGQAATKRGFRGFLRELGVAPDGSIPELEQAVRDAQGKVFAILRGPAPTTVQEQAAQDIALNEAQAALDTARATLAQRQSQGASVADLAKQAQIEYDRIQAEANALPTEEARNRFLEERVKMLQEEFELRREIALATDPATAASLTADLGDLISEQGYQRQLLDKDVAGIIAGNEEVAAGIKDAVDSIDEALYARRQFLERIEKNKRKTAKGYVSSWVNDKGQKINVNENQFDNYMGELARIKQAEEVMLPYKQSISGAFSGTNTAPATSTPEVPPLDATAPTTSTSGINAGTMPWERSPWMIPLGPTQQLGVVAQGGPGLMYKVPAGYTFSSLTDPATWQPPTADQVVNEGKLTPALYKGFLNEWIGGMMASLKQMGLDGSYLAGIKRPSFRTGVANFAGGLAEVHAGELLVNLARNSTVIPQQYAQALMRPLAMPSPSYAPVSSTANDNRSFTYAPTYTAPPPSERMDYQTARTLAMGF